MDIPKYSYDIALYKIDDIRFSSIELAKTFESVRPNCSFLGLDIKQNIGNEKSICHILASGDTKTEEPNFVFFLPESFDKDKIDYKIRKITPESAIEEEDLESEDYKLLGKIADKKFTRNLLEHFVMTDVCYKYGLLADIHIKSKKIIDDIESNKDQDLSEEDDYTEDESSIIETGSFALSEDGMKIDETININPEETYNKLIYLANQDPIAFASFTSLLKNITEKNKSK